MFHDVSGRTVILACGALGLGMAVFSWSHQYQATNRSARLWGPSGVELLQGADRALAHRLDAAESQADESSFDPDGFELPGRVIRWTRDVSDEPGMEHFRHALTQDRNYLWETDRPDAFETSAWTVAIEFAEDGQRLVAAFDSRCEKMARWSPGREWQVVDCSPMADVLQRYFALAGWNGAGP